MWIVSYSHNDNGPLEQNTVSTFGLRLLGIIQQLDFNILLIAQGHIRMIKFCQKANAHFKTLFILHVSPFSSQIHKINPYTNIKQNRLQNKFLKVSSFNIPMLEKREEKKAYNFYKVRNCWYHWPF